VEQFLFQEVEQEKKIEDKNQTARGETSLGCGLFLLFGSSGFERRTYV